MIRRSANCHVKGQTTTIASAKMPTRVVEAFISGDDLAGGIPWPPAAPDKRADAARRTLPNAAVVVAPTPQPRLRCHGEEGIHRRGETNSSRAGESPRYWSSLFDSPAVKSPPVREWRKKRYGNVGRYLRPTTRRKWIAIIKAAPAKSGALHTY